LEFLWNAWLPAQEYPSPDLDPDPQYDKPMIRNLAGFSKSLFEQYFAEQKKSGEG
jgi:hypothetical protein